MWVCGTQTTHPPFPRYEAGQRPSAAVKVDRPEAQAVFLSGVGMPTVDMLAAAEKVLGKPAISSAAAMMWNALRVAGVKTPVPGRGRLLAGPR